MEPQQNDVSRLLRGALQKRAKTYRAYMKIGCMEPDKDDGPKKMAAAILRARKQNKKKK